MKPWSRIGVHVFGPDDVRIGLFAEVPFTKTENEANATLATAAPVLLDAVVGLLTCLDDGGEEMAERVAAAEAAVKAATGGDLSEAPNVWRTLDRYRKIHDIVSAHVEDPDSFAWEFFGDRYDTLVELLEQCANA